MSRWQRNEFDRLCGFKVPVWVPLEGPQSAAYDCAADVVGYGGAAGGGKTDLAIGKALTRHKRVAIFRREGTEMAGIVDRLKEIVGHDNGYVGSGRWWGWNNPVPGVQIEFGSVPNLGDEKKFQGRPKDLLVLDEAANFLEDQARFLMGWVRTVDTRQRCQTLLCFNPPTNSEGFWIVQFFAPWLDPKHPCPAVPGELRWFAMLNGVETEVPSGEHFEHNGEKIRPQSRTFIPAHVNDNPFLKETNYMAQLQALPEPLRSQMLHGDFSVGMKDSPWQVVPTEWVDIAMARWKKLEVVKPMATMGVDVARGGADKTVISRKHEGMWFDELLVYPGAETPNGSMIAGLVVTSLRDAAPIAIDVIGVGSSPYDSLVDLGLQIIGVNVSESSVARDISGRFGFFNLRSELYWKFREMLDPKANNGIALPPDTRLRADLCAFHWKPQGALIKVESREDIVKRLGRSPDYASAVILAAIEQPKLADIDVSRGAHGGNSGEYNPYERMN